MNSEQVSRKICAEQGHLIDSLKTGEIVDPHTRLVVGVFSTVCMHCGMYLDEIRGAKQIRQLRAKKAKEEPCPSRS
jgi:hypothetical protein